jgi:DNA-binding SARP family transcriptional activator
VRAARFEFKLLGPLEVCAGGCPVPIRAAKQRVVLASLLVDAGRVVAVDQLITRLWDNAVPDGAQGTLRSYVMRLRQALYITAATGPIVTCAEGYCIDLSGHALDLIRFETLVGQARTATAQGRADRASALLSDALVLWRSEPLSNVPSDVLRRDVLPRLGEQWLLARELAIDAALDVGRHQEITAELGELTTRYPLRERFWAHSYRSLSTLLDGDLGINPSPELRSLHHAILTNDPHLRTTIATARVSGTAGARKKTGRPLLDSARRRETDWRIAQDLGLLERERELQSLDALIIAACLGSGQLVRVEAAAGLGKTGLLAAARALARRAGMRVLAARGSELEREFPYGVVRQLFELVLASADSAERDDLLAGAARQVAVLFDQVDSAGHSADISFPLLHGLFLLTANLAESPLMLVIDDLHWSDGPSLRFLAYLMPRLEGLPLLVVVALRPEEPAVDRDLLGQVTTDPQARMLRPAPLSAAAAAQLVRTVVAGRAEDAFCLACHTATAGNPLLLRELIEAAAAERLEATSAGVARLHEIGPQAVQRRVKLRLARLGLPATVFCHALAILGDNAKLTHVAALAGLPPAEAQQTARLLVDIEVLRQNPRSPREPTSTGTISFVHPLIRAAVYEGLAETARLDGHARAARLLADSGPECGVDHRLNCPVM